MPERVRQFSLAPLTHFCVLSSLRRVTGSTIACRPVAGFAPISGAARLFVGRHIRAFAPGGRVRVAQPPQVPGYKNGVEGHIAVSSAPLQPHQHD